MLARILLPLSALLRPTATLAGQADSPPSQRSPVSPAFLRFDGGLVELHSSGDWGPVAGLRVGRYLDAGRNLAVVASLAGAVADAGYASLQLGFDLRVPIHPGIMPTISGRGGLLVESEFIGDVLEGSAGLAVRVGDRQWVRVEAQVGRHSESSGPRGFLVGFEKGL